MSITSAPHPTELQIHSISNSVITRYATIAEVQQIYLEIAGDSLTYWIFSNEETYDDALMRRLIEQEMAFTDLFPRTSLDFQYIPLALCPEPRECISELSAPIYQRDNGRSH